MFGILLSIVVLGGTTLGMARDYKGHKKLHALLGDTRTIIEKRDGRIIVQYEDGCRYKLREKEWAAK